MVKVTEKPITIRVAKAIGRLLLLPKHRVAFDKNPKGDPIAVAIVAGIQAAKKCGDLIPLCHSLPLTQVAIEIHKVEWNSDHPMLEIAATVEAEGKTGVEMEAYIAVAIAGVTLIDMFKGIDPDLVLTEIKLLEKTGGKSNWQRT